MTRVPRAERLALDRLRMLGPGWHPAARVGCSQQPTLRSLERRGLVESRRVIERDAMNNATIWHWRIAP